MKEEYCYPEKFKNHDLLLFLRPSEVNFNKIVSAVS